MMGRCIRKGCRNMQNKLMRINLKELIRGLVL
jgi:hypothetical protein